MGEEATPQAVRIAVALMWAALPVGAVVTVVNTLGFVRTRARLADAHVSVNADTVGAAYRRFGEFGPHRIVTIAGFFAVAAVAFAVFGRVARRRRSPGVMLLAGVLTSVYVAGLFVVYLDNPVIGFRYEQIHLGDGSLGGVPWAMPDIAPGWYVPSLVTTLIWAGVAHAAGVYLLTRSAGRTARGEVRARGRGVLLLSTPGLAAVYAIVNVAGIAAAEHPPQSDMGPDAARHFAIVYTVALGIVTLPWTVAGLSLLLGRLHPGGLVGLGVLTVPYLLTALAAWRYNPMSADLIEDVETRVVRPDWYPPLLAAFAALAGAWLIINLIAVARFPGRTSAVAVVAA